MKRYRIRGNIGAFFGVLAIFFVTVCLFLGIFLWYGRDETWVDLGREYYFLVRDCEDTTASAVAGQVYLAGGAGYLMDRAVVLSCYFSLGDAERVRDSLAAQGVEARVLTRKSRAFSLGREKSGARARVESNLLTVETCAKMLYDAANGLERSSCSQEEARAAVKGVGASLRGLIAENEGALFERWNAALCDAELRSRELAAGILYAKDLRYLTVETLLCILDADVYFA